jgi:hypothetical protein
METSSGEPAEADFDQLSAKAYAVGSTIEDKNALWRAVFALKEWNFIARGEFPNMQPYVASNEGVAKGEYMLKAFTDPKRLHAFAKDNGLLDEKGNAMILTMPVPGFMETLQSYQEMGVFGIHFNADAGSMGFFSPLAQLAAIRDFVK